MPARLLFLPGALGRSDFWRPVAECLAHSAGKILLGWPGFGDIPADPSVHNLDDLLALVVAHLDAPTALIAQSMGGTLAVRAALARPQLVTHLVLTATSGGLPMERFGAVDWRPQLAESHPQLPRWFSDERRDLTPLLPTVHAPTLLLWGDTDPISPVAVGEELARLMPQAELHVFPGAGHDLARSHAADVATLIDEHLGRAQDGAGAAS